MMLSNKPYQIALILSLIVHTTIFIGVPTITSNRPQQTKDQVEVTYIKEKIKLPTLKFANQMLPKKQNHQKYSKSVAPPPYVQKEKIFSKPDNIFVIKPELVKPEIIAVKKKIDLSESHDKRITNPVYLNYYQIIREKIKQAAYQNYTRLINGEVYLSFIIFNNGKLRDVRINDEKSCSEVYLKDIAKKTVYDASPFPNFPKDLDYPELSFNVIISFEVE